MKKRIILLLIVFLSPALAFAECSKDELNQLKKEAKNVDYESELLAEKNEERIYHFQVYGINLNERLYIKDEIDQNYFWSSKDENGLVNLGFFENGEALKYKVYSSSKTNCPHTELASTTFRLPFYNDFSQEDICKEIPKFKYCLRWQNNKELKDVEEFYKLAEEYKKAHPEEETSSEQGINFFKSKYFYFSLGAVLILIIIIITLIYRKKSKERIRIGGLK